MCLVDVADNVKVDCSIMTKGLDKQRVGNVKVNCSTRTKALDKQRTTDNLFWPILSYERFQSSLRMRP